jgi:hypothetical protein
MAASGSVHRTSKCQDATPCVVFAFNRPDKLQRILDALRPQNIRRLIVFVDGPRNPKEAPLVERCRDIARSVDWVDKELMLAEHNSGLASLPEKIGTVMQSYKSAVFVEDDCLPMPAFYDFMCQALSHYEPVKRVFSIGGYQPIVAGYFRDYPYSLVSSARFWSWGWGTWQDRWRDVAPLLPRCIELFGNWKKVPINAGSDVPLVVRSCEEGRLTLRDHWDINVQLYMLSLGQVQLLPTRGLVRNIGLDSGSHFQYMPPGQETLYQRNFYGHPLDNIVWLDNVEIDQDFAGEYHELLSSSPSPDLVQTVKSVIRQLAQHRFGQLTRSGVRLVVRCFKKSSPAKGSQ